MIPIKLNISIILCCINIIKSRRRKEKSFSFRSQTNKGIQTSRNTTTTAVETTTTTKIAGL